MRFTLLLPLAIALGTCSRTLPVHQRVTSEMTSACIEQGGSIEHRGMVGSAVCVHPYADAGRPCRGKMDCKGQCIATDWVDGQWPKTGEAHAGFCQKDDALFGCYVTIEGGKVSDAICAD